MTLADTVVCARLFARLSPQACAQRHREAERPDPLPSMRCCRGCEVGAERAALVPLVLRRRRAGERFRAYGCASPPAAVLPDPVPR